MATQFDHPNNGMVNPAVWRRKLDNRSRKILDIIVLKYYRSSELSSRVRLSHQRPKRF